MRKQNKKYIIYNTGSKGIRKTMGLLFFILLYLVEVFLFMDVGIIVHSKTGRTLRFGNVIAAKLMARGDYVEVTELKTDPEIDSGSVKQHPPFKILNLPDTKRFDVVLFGGPVWGFSATPVIIQAINESALSEKKVICFVTQTFPSASMGGTQAIKLMSETAKAAGANVLPGKSVQGLLHNQEKMMEKAATEIANLL
jgi:hypothetical protein